MSPTDPTFWPSMICATLCTIATLAIVALVIYLKRK